MTTPNNKSRRYPTLLESLESRDFLSAAPLMSYAKLPTPTAPILHTVTLPTPLAGDTLNLTAGVPFTGEVAFYPSPVLDPPLAYSATINWGDGTTSNATLQYALHGDTGGYEITGAHTYANPGTFKITTTLVSGPITTTPPLGLPTTLVATFIGKAIVTPANSSGGVTLNEIAHTPFTATVGSFTTIAPATGLKAMISWGDGTSSTGQLIPTGVTGLDTLSFDVSGAHTYAKPGTFAIHIVVFKPALTPMAALQIVTTINSTAIVTARTPISLAGAISGTYTTPLTIPDVGKTFRFTGTGTAGDLGAVTAKGTVTLPGFIANGHGAGRLVLTTPTGTVTLHLTGPAQPGFSTFPSTLNYIIGSATGAYAGDKAAGAIAVTLTPSATATSANTFIFIIS